jgi:hypothetical protein
MTRTEIQKAAFPRTTGAAAPRLGVAQYATHTPTYGTSSTTSYPYSPAPRTAGPTHRTAIIGITGLALLLAAMGGIAFLRYQETAVPMTTVQAAQPVAQSVYESQVPYLARITVPASVVAQQVPHAAAAALVADSVYAEQVPAAARITVPASVVAQQVPTAPLQVTVPHAAVAAQLAELASAPLLVPASVVAQQVPHAAAAALRADSVYAEQVPAAARITVPQSTIDSQVPEAAR